MGSVWNYAGALLSRACSLLFVHIFCKLSIELFCHRLLLLDFLCLYIYFEFVCLLYFNVTETDLFFPNSQNLCLHFFIFITHISVYIYNRYAMNNIHRECIQCTVIQLRIQVSIIQSNDCTVCYYNKWCRRSCGCSQGVLIYRPMYHRAQQTLN